MWYVEVLVADASYHKDEPLTYSVDAELLAGAIVIVPLRNKNVLGIVVRTTTKPTFVAKRVTEIPPLPALPATSLELLHWIRTYYPAPLGMITQLFLPSGLPKKTGIERFATASKAKTLPLLTEDQTKALAAIHTTGLHILHGETGTGKTRVYVELAKRSLDAGKSAIVLTPEIGLTTQLAASFLNVFGDRVIVLHSGLTETVRQRGWRWLLEQKEPVVVIGARSALFAPVQKIGLIIIDEAHETAYKQDQAPHYQTGTVAAKLAQLQNATLVLGSATPTVRDYYVASAKGRPVIRMKQLAAGESDDSAAEIVDLKDRTQFSKSGYLSDRLLEAMREKLASKEQILLFLNRRGTARMVFCERCGWQAACPHCDVPLVYHGDHHAMRCHSCGYRATAPTSCPSCQSADIIFRSIGTKAITAEVSRLFPHATIMRFDTDNKKGERLDVQFETVRSGNVDVIVGTQTLAKGLDLPKLGLVGVIIADTGLFFPDFTAQERTYQLLSQVLGRIGRGHRKGQAIIQTYAPENTVIKAVVSKNWNDFYNSELLERQKFLFPPFCHIVKLTCKRASATAAQKNSEQLAQKMRSEGYNVRIEGPAPAFREKIQNKFVWQLVIKAKHRQDLVAIIKNLPSGWSYDIDPINLL